MSNNKQERTQRIMLDASLRDMQAYRRRQKEAGQRKKKLSELDRLLRYINY